LTNIGTKLVVTFLAISVFFGMMSLVVYVNSEMVVDSFDALNNRSLPELIALRQMITDSLVVYSRAVEFTVDDIPEERANYLDEIREAKIDFSNSFQIYSSIDTLEGRPEEVVLINDKWNAFVLNADTVIRIVQDGQADENEIDKAREKLELSQEEFETAIDQIIEKQLATSQAMKTRVDSNESSLINLIVTTLVAAMLFSTGLGLAVSRTITKPLQQLKNAVIEVGRGNYKTDILVLSKDEIGELATHFEKMKHELDEKEKMQKEFLLVTSHELRTPIQPILSFAELGLKGIVPAHDALTSIKKESIRLGRLVEDILDVTKIESGKLAYDMRDVDMKELINDVITGFNSSTRPSVTIVVDLSQQEGEIRLLGDSGRLRQVLSNIIGNAIKFTKQGEIKVSCKTLSGPDFLEIKIVDSGVGIPEAVLPRLFGKFVTRDIDGNNKHGTGLGLFISKAIIEAHNGEIHACNNSEGSGSTFTIILPLKSNDVKMLMPKV
jgi:signal transduction histidine kinase